MDIGYSIFIIGKRGMQISEAVKNDNNKIRNGDGWNGRGAKGETWCHHYFLTFLENSGKCFSIQEEKV